MIFRKVEGNIDKEVLRINYIISQKTPAGVRVYSL